MLHGLNRTSAKNVRVSSDKVKQDKIVEGADISTHTTDDAVSFRVQPTGAHSRRMVPDAVSFRVQPTGAHSRRMVPDDQDQPASEGLARKSFDRIAS